MLKKVLSLLLVTIFGFTLLACKTTTSKEATTNSTTTNSTTTNGTTTTATQTTTTVPTDKIPPAFVGAVNGQLQAVEHLKDDELDLLDGVQARDNVAGTTVNVTIVNYGGYDKGVPGEYTLTIQAEDEAGNKTTATKKVTVLPTLERTFDALKIGDNLVEYAYNDTTAMEYETVLGYGLLARTTDVVQIMSKDFFVAEYDEHKALHSENGNVPYLPYGVLVITDSDYKVKLVRLDVGILAEINSENVLTTEGLTWAREKSATKPGGVLAGIYDQLGTLIPDGGYLFFSSSFGDQRGRKFITNNFFYSEYAGGATTAANFNRDVRTVEMQLIEDYKEKIAVPAKLPAPVISIAKHILSWEAISNIKEYEIYVDGELKKTTTATTIMMADLELALTPEGDAGYDITVKAITKDMFKWSTSDLSNTLVYKKIDIVPVVAPVVTINGKVVTWDLVDGAASYDVYIKYAGKSVKLANVTEGTYDLSSFNNTYVGYNNVYVIAIGDDDHLDSAASNSVEVFLGEVKALTIGGYTVDVIETSALNYFTRRNTTYTTDKTGFAAAPYLFLITDINSIKDPNFGATVNEAVSTVVLLDSQGKPKLINNILAKQTWKVGQGWLDDGIYAANNAQLTNIKDALAEGDMLLIGKNGNNVTATKADQTTVTIGARELLAYFYVKPWDTFPTAPVSPNGWRAPMDQFIDPTNVTFTVTTKQ